MEVRWVIIGCRALKWTIQWKHTDQIQTNLAWRSDQALLMNHVEYKTNWTKVCCMWRTTAECLLKKLAHSVFPLSTLAIRLLGSARDTIIWMSFYHGDTDIVSERNVYWGQSAECKNLWHIGNESNPACAEQKPVSFPSYAIWSECVCMICLCGRETASQNEYEYFHVAARQSHSRKRSVGILSVYIKAKTQLN